MDTGSGTEDTNTRDDVSETTELEETDSATLEVESTTSLEVTEDELTIELDGVADGRATDELLGMTSGTAGRQP